MNLKKLILGLFLVPFAIASRTIDLQIQELKKNLYEKEQELSKIVEMIDAKENIIDTLASKTNDLISQVIGQLDDEETQEFRNEIVSFQINLQQSFKNQESIKYLFNENFTDKSKENLLELKRVKYLLIRYTFEYINLIKITEQYEKCLKELTEIDFRLNKLQK